MIFIGNCVDVDTYEGINEMRDQSCTVTWQTFRKHCPEARLLFESLGGIDGATNKQIEESSFFSFHKSKFEGQPCYYACWSGYEWIFQGD